MGAQFAEIFLYYASDDPAGILVLYTDYLIIGGLQMFDVPQILTNGQEIRTDIHDTDHVLK